MENSINTDNASLMMFTPSTDDSLVIIYKPKYNYAPAGSPLYSKKNPYNKDMESLQARINSFDGKPMPRKHKPEAMADAGFYRIDGYDNVKCYVCGMGIINWQRVDEPWEQHEIWNKDCELVLEHSFTIIQEEDSP